ETYVDSDGKIAVKKNVPVTGFGKKLAKSILLMKQMPEGTKVGDSLEVFFYKDSSDRLIATRKTPALTLGQVGWLRVAAVGKVGAFLNWGLDKDLLLPFREQPKTRVREGQEVLVAVYIDKSERLCATMNVYPYLRTDSPYKAGDQVTGVVYETSSNFGTFVAVDSIYSALIPQKELVHDIRIGETVSARVTQVRPDGKLDLSIREKAYLQMDRDGDKIMAALEAAGGTLMLCDKSSPELIREKMQMSKNEFKRAIGRLYRDGKIRIGEECIVKTEE
ncbi:MAG: S1 RNA-binding domain-containing protein, partial [Lachnospiraceae bacterium]|nr:S1 RNA-binding domain-containing protein [Lachnospiraceae bacterium]